MYIKMMLHTSMKLLFCLKNILNQTPGKKKRQFFKKLFFKILQYSQDNTCVFQAFRQLYQKDTPAQVFSCEYCGIFKNTYFVEHLPIVFCAQWMQVDLRFSQRLLSTRVKMKDIDCNITCPPQRIVLKTQTSHWTSVDECKRVQTNQKTFF